jgi:uncharacterized lipoprotein YehR (DUF1307 family)
MENNNFENAVYKIPKPELTSKNFDPETKTLTLNLSHLLPSEVKKLNIVFKGDFEIQNTGEFSILNDGNFSIDTDLDKSGNKKIHLNSKMVQSIRDLQESIDYRDQQMKEVLSRMKEQESQIKNLLDLISNLSKENGHIGNKIIDTPRRIELVGEGWTNGSSNN